MSAPLHVKLIRPDSNWLQKVSDIRLALGAPHNPQLLPDHFVKVVLPKIGGALISVNIGPTAIGYGFLFPHHPGHRHRAYTLRYHSLPNSSAVDRQAVTAAASKILDAPCRFYDPADPLHYSESHHQLGSLDFGHPGGHEVATVRQLQQQIWNNPTDALYPVDIHSDEFGLATSLVTRSGSDVVAFLFGFYKFGEASLPTAWSGRLQTSLRIESQTMGVSPAQRGKRIGYTLKCVQADAARRQGIDMINWTVDPLQFPNAALNFSLLRGVAYEFYPDHYDLHNALNQVSASRFNLTWLITSERVRNAAQDVERTGIVRLDAFPEIVHVNDGWNKTLFNVTAPLIAVEIPVNWSLLQNQSSEEAQRWRKATDPLFVHYVGKKPGQYMITAAGVDGDRRYLIGERVDDAFLERLIQ